MGEVKPVKAEQISTERTERTFVPGHAHAQQAGAHHRAALRLGFMWGRSSLSSMLVLLSRLEMYSSFSFTTYTHAMHQYFQGWAAHNGCTRLECLFMQRTSTECTQKGPCSFDLQYAYLLKHAVPALQASLLLRHLREPCAQLCHLQGGSL